MKKKKETLLTIVSNENELTVVNDGDVIDYSNGKKRLNNYISGLLFETETELETNYELQEIIGKKVVADTLVNETKYNFQVSTIKLDYEVTCFLNRSKVSDTTKNNYKRWLKVFLIGVI